MAKSNLPSKAPEITSFAELVESGNVGFEDLLLKLRATQQVVAAAEVREELGELWTVCEDKQLLVGQPFVIVDYVFREGDYGDYCSLRVFTPTGQRLIVNDGSTGICEQMRRFSHGKRALEALYCPKGLSVSKDYHYTNDKGDKVKGQPIYRLNLG